jgi:hypothetical protein
MAEKKPVKKTEKKPVKKTEKKPVKKTEKKMTKVKIEKTKSSKATKSKTKKITDDSDTDLGIVIVDDDIQIDQEKVNEERRAYLEEARSQEAYD